MSKDFVTENLRNKRNLQLVLVNSDPADFKKIPSSTSSLDSLSKLAKHKVIVVEDIISVSRKEEQLLRLCLNKYAHHKLQKYFFVSHSIFKTSMFGMVPFFNYIIIIKSETNLKNFKDILKYFRTEEKEFNQLVSNFLKICKQFPDKDLNQFFFYSTNLQKMFFCQHWRTNPVKALNLDNLSPANHPTSADVSKRAKKNTERAREHQLTQHDQKHQQISERFEQLTSFYPKKDQAKIIFSFILPCLEEKLIRLSDLTFKFESAKSKNIRISLLDYVTNLLEEDSPIPIEHKVLHHYLKSKCVIPNIFVRNKHFKNG